MTGRVLTDFRPTDKDKCLVGATPPGTPGFNCEHAEDVRGQCSLRKSERLACLHGNHRYGFDPLKEPGP